MVVKTSTHDRAAVTAARPVLCRSDLDRILGLSLPHHLGLRLVVAAALALGCASLGWTDSGQTPVEEATQSDGGQRANGDRLAHSATVLHSRRVETQLSEIRAQLAAGRLQSAIDGLSGLLDDDSHWFVPVDGIDRPVWQIAHELVQTLPDNVRQTFAERREKAARRAFETASEQDDRLAIRRLIEREGPTEVGLQATQWWAAVCWDRGDFVSAADAYAAVGRHPKCNPADADLSQARQLLALALSGRVTQAHRDFSALTPDRLPTNIRIGGEVRPLYAWLKSQLEQFEPEESDPPLVGSLRSTVMQ